MPVPIRLAVAFAILTGCSIGCSHAESSKTQRASADFNAFGSSIRVYKINTGELPPPESGLKALVERPASLHPNQSWTQVAKKIPTDPWGNPYRYLAGEGLKEGFGLYSCGPDGISSSAGNDPDDLNSWTDKSPTAPSRQESWKLYALVGAAIVAAGSFLLGYRVAMKEARRGS